MKKQLKNYEHYNYVDGELKSITTTRQNDAFTTTTRVKTVKSKKEKFRSVYNTSSNIFTLILFVLIIVFLARLFTGSTEFPTFYNLLNVLSEMPQIEFDMTSLVNLTIGGNWGVIDGLRVFINLIISVINFLVYCIGGLVQVLVFVTYFLGWAFGFV